jgi:hypothetical protein
VTITVTAPGNTAPTADAGPDQSVSQGSSVTLDGTGSSDPDSGQTLTYAWTQTAGASVTLSSSTAASPTFTAPTLVIGDTDETLTFQLTVNDGITDSAADSVTITVTAPANTAPTADAGPDQSVEQSSSVTLDGTGSDANDAGQTLTYAWTQTAGASVTLSSSTAASPTFTAPALVIGDADLTLTFQLIVDDGFDASSPDTVTVTVTAPANNLPTADAGADQDVASAATVTLDGTGSSDADMGQTLTYTWSQTAGPTVTLSSASADMPTFAAPATSLGGGDILLTFQLIVNDGFSDSAPDTVTITVLEPPDTIAPTVSIDGAPASYSAGTPFTVTINFSETVIGFDVGDVGFTNSTITGFSGSGASYSVEFTPSGTADIQISVAASVATDAAGNPNTAATDVIVAASALPETEAFIADTMVTRGRALIASQPNLRNLLTGSRGGASASVTRGVGTYQLQTGMDSALWLYATGQWSNDGDLDASYANAALGANLVRTDGLVLGLMLQADRIKATELGARFEGTGWLAGPYAVFRLSDQPLVFSASYLAGRTDNTVTGGADGDFESRRTLLTFGVQGEIQLDRITLMPNLDLARVTDRHDGYTASGGGAVAAESVVVEEASFGLDFEAPLPSNRGALALIGGVSGIYSRAESSLGTETENRARIDLGFRYEGEGGGRLSARAYVDGLGSSYSAHGADLMWELRF